MPTGSTIDQHNREGASHLARSLSVVLSPISGKSRQSPPRDAIDWPWWLAGARRSGSARHPDLAFRTGPNNASKVSRLMTRGILAGSIPSRVRTIDIRAAGYMLRATLVIGRQDVTQRTVGGTLTDLIRWPRSWDVEQPGAGSCAACTAAP